MDTTAPRQISAIRPGLAIVGLAAHIGADSNLDTVAHTLYDSARYTAAPSSSADDLSADHAGRLHTVIMRALEDAGRHTAGRVVVLVSSDPEQVSRLLRASAAPTANVQASSGSLFDDLTTAQQLLSTGAADTVVLGTAHLPDTQASADAAPDAVWTLSYDRHAGTLPAADAAVAVALQRPDSALNVGSYASIEALGHARRSGAAAVAQVCLATAAAAEIAPGDIGYLEAWASGSASADEAELTGLRDAYQQAGPELTCALGSVKANFGHTGPAAALLGLLRTAMCLYERYIPGTPGWTGPRNPVVWESSPFYVAPESRPWFSQSADSLRRAAFSVSEPDGTPTHLVLSEVHTAQPRSSAYLIQQSLRLFPFAAASQDELLAQLATFEQEVQQNSDLGALARRCFDAWRAYDRPPYALALVAQNQPDLLREIERARSGIPQAFASGGEWKTPGGSYFTVRPLGPHGKVAFVYPGAFNAYPGLGQHLFHLFPTLYERLGSITDHIGALVGDERLYPRSRERLSGDQMKNLEASLVDQPISMLETGTGFAMLYTLVMRDLFGVQPDMAFGYSQGETAMLHALRVWKTHSETTAMLHRSDLYKTRLAGTKFAVREFWGLSPTPNTEEDADLWANYILMAPAEEVEPHIEEESRVYLAIINTPREVMITGDRAGCQRVIAKVKCRSLRAPFNHVIHSPPVQSEYDEFVRMNCIEVQPTAGLTFYSAANYGPLALESETVAHSIARVCCQQLDFLRLTNRVYDDGARIFLELGPARNCTHWIDTTLKGREHLAVATNKKGTPDHVSLVRVLAQLLSHGVPLNLTPLYERVHDTTAPSAVQPVAAPVPVLHAAEQVQMAESDTELARDSQMHAAFLRERTATLHALSQSIQQYMTDVQQALTAAAPLPAAPLSGSSTANGAATATATAAPPASAPPRVEQPAPVNRFTPSTGVLIDEQRVREFTLGSVAATLGEEYHIFDQRRSPRTPNGDMQMMSRVVRVDGPRYKLQPGTLLVSEYDVPVDTWFYRDNAYAAVPYSVLMEMALQPCGFLSAYLGSLLLFPDADLYFRNLDGRGLLQRPADIRGKTVTNHARLLSSTFIQGIIIQKFAYQLFADGEPFYEGDSVFGYFTHEALDNQIGLDNGKHVLSWLQQHADAAPATSTIDLHNPATRQRLYSAPVDRPHERLAHGQLDLLDWVTISEQGGNYGQGYIHASRALDPDAWFFTCHFFQDPVMPGSFGVEGIFQAMQVYALQRGLGRQFVSPHFECAPGYETNWKYRGQIVREAGEWSLEVHIRQIETRPEQIVIVAEASVWRERLRIYEVQPLALRILETQPAQ